MANRWTPEELAILRKNLNAPPSTLAALLPGRSRYAIKHQQGVLRQQKERNLPTQILSKPSGQAPKMEHTLKGPFPPEEADLKTISAWAALYAPGAKTVADTNAVRKALNLPPFRVKKFSRT